MGIANHPKYGPTLNISASHFGSKTNEIEHYTDVSYVRRLAVKMTKAAGYGYPRKRYCGEESDTRENHDIFCDCGTGYSRENGINYKRKSSAVLWENGKKDITYDWEEFEL